MPSPRILIVGGSTRAAADSVRRAGGQPVCADLFADLDLRQTAEVIPVRNYPDSLPTDVADVRADGWFYCGALENHPEILTRILTAKAGYGPLLGTSPDALKLVRNPQWLAETLQVVGMNTLAIASQFSPPASDGSWLQKPLASAGGRSIRVWDDAARHIPFLEPHYFQRRANGIGLSALFRVENGDIEWLGASREIEANAASQPPAAFSYCGSCGPLKRIPIMIGDAVPSITRFRLSFPDMRLNDAAPARFDVRYRVHGNAVYHAPVQRQLTLVARTLVRRAAGLRGLVGLDFRLNGNDVWLLEVNPRYTASVEVLELASGRSLLNRDVKAHAVRNVAQYNSAIAIPPTTAVEEIFGWSTSPCAVRESAIRRPLVIAKQILYASDRLIVPDLSRFSTIGDPWRIPMIADIPIPGTLVEPGWPICTIMAAGTNLFAAESTMLHRISQIHDALNGTP